MKTENSIFGMTCPQSQSKLQIIPVPFEGTVSYGTGTSQAPWAIQQTSDQIDLYDIELKKDRIEGIHLLDQDPDIVTWNQSAIKIRETMRGHLKESWQNEQLDRANVLGKQVRDRVLALTRTVITQGALPAILGGEHSVALGGLLAAREAYSSFSVLQIDAHSDTRKAYKGYKYSHASVMYNALTSIPEITSLTQIATRDLSAEEESFNAKQNQRVTTFYDSSLFARKAAGESWGTIASDLVNTLSEHVWISFDIDGLDPKHCPNTGTPVPGGLSYNEANYLIGELYRSGKRIIGFDLCEVTPPINSPTNPSGNTTEWDANVAMRILYRLCAWTLASNGALQHEN